MKKSLALSLILLCSLNAHAAQSSLSESKLLEEAIQDGYQTQRNLAFFYQTGRSGLGGNEHIAKDEIKSCAWRKILLFANPKKTDETDAINERESCQNLNQDQDWKVWKIVYHYISLIDAHKSQGKYMVKKDDPLPEGELGIIEVDPQ